MISKSGTLPTHEILYWQDDITYFVDGMCLAVGADDDGDDGRLAARFSGLKLVAPIPPEVPVGYRVFPYLVNGWHPHENLSKYYELSSGLRDYDILIPLDFRLLLAVGPTGSLLPGQTEHVVFAIVNGVEESDLIEHAMVAQKMWECGLTGASAPLSPDFTVATGDGIAAIRWQANAEQSIEPLTGNEDFQGYRIWRTPDGDSWTLLATYDLPDTLGLNAGWPPPISDDENYSYELLDEGLMNGSAFSYAVTAFDDGHNGDGMNSSSCDERHIGIGVMESSREEDVRQTVVPAASTQPEGVLKNIYVVPNPYIGSSRLEQHGWSGGRGRIEFRGLPPECEIQIYTLAGDLVRELKHNDGLSWESWDARNEGGEEIAGGIYIYRVNAAWSERIDKFLVVK